MKVLAAVLLLAAAASAGVIPATTLVRTPSLDSAVIQSDRLGGNFAYSSVEGHAYAAITPVVQNVVQPVGVSYTAHQVPVGLAISSPAVVAAPAIAPAHAVIAGPAPAVVAAPVAAPAYVPGITLAGIPSLVAGPAAVAPVASAPAAAPAPAPAPAPAAEPSADSVSVESA